MVFIRPQWWAQSRSFPVLLQDSRSSFVAVILFDCWAFFHLPFTSILSSNTEDLLNSSHQCVRSLQSCCLSFSSSPAFIDVYHLNGVLTVWVRRFYYFCRCCSSKWMKSGWKRTNHTWKHKSSQYQALNVVLFLWVAVSLLLLSPLYIIKRMILPSLCIQLPLHLVAYSKIMRPPSALWKAQSSV